MRVLFIHKDFFPHYGLLCLASAVRKWGHTCDIAISDLDNLEDIYASFQPDAVALTFTSGQAEWAAQTARSAKASLGRDLIVIAGGFHATFFPEIAEEEWYDYCLRGEGDVSLPLLLDALENGGPISAIPNLAYIKQDKLVSTPVLFPHDLDALPFPAYDLLERYSTVKHLGYLNPRASRGCIFRCNFCYASALRRLFNLRGQSLFRRKSPRRTISEIKYALSLFPDLSFVKFDDDTFNTPPDSWLEEFSSLYADEIGLPFNCLARIDLVNNKTAQLLKDAGCTAVRFGIESANDNIRNNIYGKGLRKKDIIKGTKALKKAGLVTIGINIVGSPGETITDALETYRFSQSLGVDCADCLNLYAYPGTELAKNGGDLKYDEEYFYFFPRDDVPDEFENIVCLFSWGTALRIPPWLFSILIRIPPNPLYRIILWSGQGLIKLKMREHRMRNLLGMTTYAKRFFTRGS